MVRRNLVLLGCLGAALLGAVAGSIQIFDHDAWMHVAAGRLILESGLPSTNSFSWTFPDHPWKDVEWLFDLLVALCHKWWGWYGVSFLQAFFLAGTSALLWDAGRRRWRGKYGSFILLGTLLLLLVLVESRFRFNHRPEIATLLFTALTLWLWERRPRRLPLWLFLSSAVWVNLHPGILFGLGVCVAYAAGDLLARGRSALKPGLAATAAFFAGTLLNPHFLYPYQYLWANATGLFALDLTELRPPALVHHPVFFLMSLLVVAASIEHLRRRVFTFPLLAVVFLAAAMVAQRLIPIFLLVTMQGLFESAGNLRSLPRGKGRLWIVVPGVGFTLLALFLAWGQFRLFLPSYPFGWGVNPIRAPEKATAIIAERALQGRIFNPYGVGSYLMAVLPRHQRVFSDSRAFAYPPEFLGQMAAIRSPSELGSFLDRWRADIAVVQSQPDLQTADHSILLESLGWRLVSFDGFFRLYVRPGSPDEGKVADLVFHHLRSGAAVEELLAGARTDPGGLKAELERIDPRLLFHSGDFHRFGLAALESGDPALAETIFRSYDDLYPESLVPDFLLGLALNAQGRSAEARERLERVIRSSRDPQLRLQAAQARKGT